MYTLEKPTQAEYPDILQIWEASVRATHHFLTEKDIDFYKTLLQENQVFRAVHLVVARNSTHEIVGFMGVAGDKLEMLFLRPESRGKGIGKILIKHAIEELHIKKVDVNEQNEEAVNFYRHMGFQVIARSALDATGKSYPTLHLQLLSV